MFSTRRPRNLVAGVASGGKSLLKGFFGGAVGLVAAPIVGAKDNGLQGFVAGLGTGLVGAIALPVTGAAIASFQVVRGVINTGEAIVEGAAGKDWDEERREWYAHDL